MSSYDKVVKLACKPKAAPPKAKYLDPIIAATWSEDGAVHDVCKALSPRFREPNAIIVFKALIVLHTMIRNGATDNVLTYLSSGDILRLRNVGHGQWEGYDTPQNLAHYAHYLDSRVKAYRDLKHDAVRVQSESNRDMRVSQSVEAGTGSRSPGGPQRSKTISGRKLRSMTVEKGLLRETRAVHRMLDALIECKFYLDDLEDELTITALRMLVKDLLVLFQAGNEGVINVLEHYFEMSHIDAKEALAIYRHFCKQTEHIVEYLGVAKKLQNLLNVPIPNLKHAPVSLVGALEEYLNDPNFEENRREYKANKAAADRSSSAPLKSALKKDKVPPSPSVPPVPKTDAAASSSSSKPEQSQAMIDFFSSIDAEQQTMFNPQSGSPSLQHFQNQATYNPFVQRQSMAVPSQMTGVFAQQQHPFVQAQQTGFLQPQHTAFQTSPFPQVQQQQQQHAPGPFLQSPPQQGSSPFQQQRQSAFIQPQSTGFLQPQATGSNPFRQSMLFPQSTGLPSFTTGSNAFSGAPASVLPQPFSAQGTGFTRNPQQASPFSTSPPITNGNAPFTVPNRPQSTPITSQQKPLQPLTAVTTHQTGSKNPFGVPVMPAPPVPKPPTLQELATGAFGNSNAFGNGSAFGHGSTASSTSGQGQLGQTNPSSPQSNGQPLAGSSNMASVASSFASKPSSSTFPGSSSGFGSINSNPFPNLAPQHTSTTFSDFSSLSNNPTGSTAPTTAPSISPVQPQQTGFGGVKPFKPSSSFGATLLDFLPPIAGSPAQSNSNTGTSQQGQQLPGTGPGAPGSPVSSYAGSGLPSFNNPSFSFNSNGSKSQPAGLGALNVQQTGQPSFGGGGIGVGLRPQTTGGPNPFRASMMAPSASTPSFGSNPPFQSTAITGSAFPPSNLFNNPTGTTPFSGTAFGATPGQTVFGSGASNQNAPQQQNGSLI